MSCYWPGCDQKDLLVEVGPTLLLSSRVCTTHRRMLDEQWRALYTEFGSSSCDAIVAQEEADLQLYDAQHKAVAGFGRGRFLVMIPLGLRAVGDHCVIITQWFAGDSFVAAVDRGRALLSGSRSK